MMKSEAKLLLLLAFTLFQGNIQAQKYWLQEQESFESYEQLKNIKDYQIFRLDISTFKDELASVKLEKTSSTKNILELPIGNEELLKFEVVESPIMENQLIAKYSQIKTYSGIGIQQRDAQVRFDWTSTGFHAYIYTSEGTILIDPLAGKEGLYVVYDKKNAENAMGKACGTTDSDKSEYSSQEKNTNGSGKELRIVRAAFASTGEFANERLARTNDPLEAIITLTNRLNLIFERDLTLRLMLVDGSDKIAFTNPETDPYSNDAYEMLSENIAVLNDSIGMNDYDLGHVFTSNARGGVAGVAIRGSICTQSAASGVSSYAGNEADYLNTLAHEIGHQLGAGHTWNRCGEDSRSQRSNSTAVEPGSGSTIMSYAGLCGADNVSSGFDYFHSVSVEQINQRLSNADCYSVATTGNTPPEVSIPYENGFYIPINTPFELTAFATDAEEDRLTYSWEQVDRGPSTPPEEPSGDSPSFKGYAPKPSPTRVFPNFFSQILNTSSRGEIIPTYARKLSFAVIVRDNRSGGGGTDQDEFFFRTTENADSFIVTYPNSRDIEWEMGKSVEVTWNVAGSDLAPVNCSTVDILLSYTNGSDGFPDTLAKAVPNTGSAIIVVPEQKTNRARIKIKASSSIFFDYSDTFFPIIEPLVKTNDFLTKNGIKIYPNPTDGLLFIYSDKNANAPITFSIWNIQGKQLLEGQNERTFRQQFDLSSFPKGVYFLRISSAEGTALKKIVLD